MKNLIRTYYSKLALRILFLFIPTVFANDTFGQFYSGHQINFGKNRLQFKNFTWQNFRFERYDVYFSTNGKEIAEFAARTINEELPKLESFFQHTVSQRLIFLSYNTITDFKQSNIGYLSSNYSSNIGGATAIQYNKVFLYFTGDYNEFRKQIVNRISQIILSELLYGNDFFTMMTNNTILNIPDWYFYGLISWISENWSVEIEGRIKDGFTSGRYEDLNKLKGRDAVFAGHSIWEYIAQTYGHDLITNILYLTRISKNVDNGFLFSLGISFKDLSQMWIAYYSAMFIEYFDDGLIQENELIKKHKKGAVYQQLKLSPDKTKIAYTSNEMGKSKIYFQEIETGKKRKIFRKGHKLEQITDYTYPILEWHPSGNMLTFIAEWNGKIWYSTYDLESRKVESTPIFHFSKILSYDFSDNDPFSFVMSAVKKGQTDIYLYSIIGRTGENITNDKAGDFNPRFIENGSKIIFSSNRLTDSVSSANNYGENRYRDIFVYDINKNAKQATRITNTRFSNEDFAFEIEKYKYTYLSDRSGITNRFITNFDSTIAYIDTSIHYTYLTPSTQVSDFKFNILEHDIVDEDLVQSYFQKNRNNFQLNSDKNWYKKTFDIAKTPFKREQESNMLSLDSLEFFRKEVEKELLRIYEEKKKEAEKDTLIDVLNYVFEKEKLPSDPILLAQQRKKDFEIPNEQFYSTYFYNNKLVAQIDFSFLNLTYQTFTGGPVFFSPGLNSFIKIGTQDLFEDYRLTGGIRLSMDLNSFEYLINLEDIKSRYDKKMIFYRQVLQYTNPLIKSYNNTLMYVLKYPFNQVSAIQGTISGRHDKMVTLSTDISTLQTDNVSQNWGGLKLEYTFDNSIEQATNIYFGTRIKVFAESMFKIQNQFNDLNVIGADFRHYQKIYRNFIWASRIATSASFGKSKLIYYLGSVDNWYNFSSTTPTFDYSTEIDYDQNYEYQALATNMRGFVQNSRNGTSFLVANQELRFPVISFFFQRPISSNFLANLQLIGFLDVGTAWTGILPGSENNAYNQEITTNGPITIVRDLGKDPWIYGYGFGARTKLLGYFVRCDWAWGIENNIRLPRVFYLSLATDF